MLIQGDVSIQITELPVIPCAWCLSEQGLSMGDGSHGICQKHADKMLLDQRRKRRSQWLTEIKAK